MGIKGQILDAADVLTDKLAKSGLSDQEKFELIEEIGKRVCGVLPELPEVEKVDNASTADVGVEVETEPIDAAWEGPAEEDPEPEDGFSEDSEYCPTVDIAEEEPPAKL